MCCPYALITEKIYYIGNQVSFYLWRINTAWKRSKRLILLIAVPQQTLFFMLRVFVRLKSVSLSITLK